MPYKYLRYILEILIKMLEFELITDCLGICILHARC